jgi:hypothetical protein
LITETAKSLGRYADFLTPHLKVRRGGEPFSAVLSSEKHMVKSANAQKARYDLNNLLTRADRLKPQSSLSRQPHFVRDYRCWFEKVKIAAPSAAIRWLRNDKPVSVWPGPFTGQFFGIVGFSQ